MVIVQGFDASNIRAFRLSIEDSARGTFSAKKFLNFNLTRNNSTVFTTSHRKLIFEHSNSDDQCSFLLLRMVVWPFAPQILSLFNHSVKSDRSKCASLPLPSRIAAAIPNPKKGNFSCTFIVASAVQYPTTSYHF